MQLGLFQLAKVLELVGGFMLLANIFAPLGLALLVPVTARLGRSLERSGLITRDMENAYLAFDSGEEAPINALLGASITYRIATGPREGEKVFTLQTLPAEPDAPRREVAESSGFSLHTGRARIGSGSCPGAGPLQPTGPTGAVRHR